MLPTEGSSKQNEQLRRLSAGLPEVLAHRAEGVTPPTASRQRQRRLTPGEVEQLVGQYESGADMKVLAAQWGLHDATVSNHLRAAGTVLRRQGLLEAQLVEAVRLYAAGWSCRRLAAHFGTGHDTVRKRLKRAGVQLRPKG